MTSSTSLQFEEAQSVEPTVVISPSDGQLPDVESLTSRLSLPEIHFDLTKGFPRIPHKLSLKEKAVKIVGALMTTPPVHLSLLLGQMLACLLSAVYAVSQLIVVGSPRVPSYFQLSRESLADTLEGYFQSTWSGVFYCTIYSLLCLWSITRMVHQVFLLPLHRGSSASLLQPFNPPSSTTARRSCPRLDCLLSPWRALVRVIRIYLDYRTSWFWKRYILSQVIDVIIQSLAWLELGGVDVLSVGGRTQVAPPRLLMSHAFLLSIDLLSVPLLYYHGCVKLAVVFDAAIDLGYAFDWLLGLPSFVSLFCPTKWYALHHDTFTIFLSTVLPLAAVTMNFYQIDKLTLRGEPFTYDAHPTIGAGRFSRKSKRAKFIWLLSFIMVLMSSWALGLFAVIYTAVTQFGTDCGSSFDPLAWCRWSVRPFLGPNACDCRLVVGQTHTLDEEHGGSNCAVLPEVLDRWPRVEYLVMSPTPDVLWHCSIDDDEVDWVSEKMRFVKVLSLPYQNITRLNQSFGTLTSLSLPYNFLTRLEAGVLRMNPGLEHLSVEMNNLSELPNEVFSMNRLQGLSLMGNPVCSSPEYDGALEDLATRGVSPLCGDTPWQNKRNHRERARNDDYSESPVKDEIICGASPRADPLAFATVYYRGICDKYKHSPSSECLAVCDEVASWISYTADDDDGILSLAEMNRYLQLIGIRPYSSQGEMECMVRVMDCRQGPTMPAFPPTPYTIAMMMSGGVTDCSHCPYHVR